MVDRRENEERRVVPCVAPFERRMVCDRRLTDARTYAREKLMREMDEDRIRRHEDRLRSGS